MGLLSSGVKAVSKAVTKGKKARTIVGKAGKQRKGMNKAFEKKLKNLSKKTGEAKQLEINALKGMKKRNVIDKDLLSDFKKVQATPSKKPKLTPVDEVDKYYGNPNIDNMSDKEVIKWEKEYGSALKEAKKVMGLKKKSGGVVKKAGGGMTRQGLYPAEMARAGTMSQARRKRYMKKGGKITYRMTGGQVVSHGYD